MEKVNYSAYDLICSLVLEDKDINEISKELNLEKSFVVTLLKKVRNDYILSCNLKLYIVVGKIDKLLKRKKKRKIINNFGGRKDIIFNLLCDGKGCIEICNLLGIGVEGYINFLKFMYYELYLYGLDCEKIYLSVIRRAIIEGYKVLKSDVLSERRNGGVNIKPAIMRLRGLNDEIVFTSSPISGVSSIDCEDIFKFIVISDLHIGSRYENIGYVCNVYNDAVKNGISDIFISGDFVEGCHANYGRCFPKYSSTVSQVEHVLNDYPFDKNINNHILLGNHEAFPIIIEGYDMFCDMQNRKDFDVIGYRSGYYKIKNEYISLKHEISRVINEIVDNVVLFNFIGHSHLYKCTYDGKYVTFRVPTCSDLVGHDDKTIINKGYLVCEVHFNSIGKADELSVVYKDFENENVEISFERKLTK